jgi:hypothetical protein
MPALPVEKSVWEYDEDDVRASKHSPTGSISTTLAAKLHIRTASTGTRRDILDEKDVEIRGEKEFTVYEFLVEAEKAAPKKIGKPKRSASDVLKRVFGFGKES